MALPISEIVKQAAIDIGIEEPSGAIVSSTDKNIKQLLQHSLKTGRELRDKYLFPQLKRQYSVTITSSSDQYTLPGDMWRMISDTQWNQTNSWKLNGPLNDQEWNTQKYGVVATGSRKKFRVFGNNEDTGRFFIDPEPSVNEVISFDYIRKQWIFPKAWVASTAYTSGNYVSANGNIYTAGSTATSGATRPSGTTTSSDGTITWTYVANQLYGDSTERWQADTDFPLIDSDLIILGTVWRYLKRKGLDYQEEKQEYERQCSARLSRLEGSQILNFAGGNSLFADNVPEGSFG